MTEDDKKFLDWWMVRWLSNQHNITMHLIDEASMLMGEILETGGRWNLDNTVKKIHEKGLQLYKDSLATAKTKHEDFESGERTVAIFEVDPDTFKKLKISDEIEIQQKKSKKK